MKTNIKINQDLLTKKIRLNAYIFLFPQFLIITWLILDYDSLFNLFEKPIKIVGILGILYTLANSYNIYSGFKYKFMKARSLIGGGDIKGKSALIVASLMSFLFTLLLYISIKALFE